MSTVAVAKFETSVHIHLAQWLNHHPTSIFDDLAVMLGFAYVPNFSGRPLFSIPRMPEAECEDVVHGALLLLIKYHDAGDSQAEEIEKTILSGLLINERWRRWLELPETAYELAAFLIGFYSRPVIFGGLFETKRQRPLRDQMNTQIGPWLGLDTCMSVCSQRMIAAALFGDAWCSLVGDDLSGEESWSDHVLLSRPPFFPGLLPVKFEVPAQPLPLL
jgi:hypothetical protein